jgi:hypothetical protein
VRSAFRRIAGRLEAGRNSFAAVGARAANV